MKRRSILSLLGAAPALLAGSRLEAAQKSKHTSMHSSGAGDKLTGLNPRGTPPPVKLHAMAPRPKTIDGKTIYMVWDGFPGGDTFLHEMQKWFSKHMPSVKTVYRRKAGGFAADDPKLRAELKAHANAVIMAIGH